MPDEREADGIPPWGRKACEEMRDVLAAVWRERGEQDAFAVLGTVIASFIRACTKDDQVQRLALGELVKAMIDVTLGPEYDEEDLRSKTPEGQA